MKILKGKNKYKDIFTYKFKEYFVQIDEGIEK